MAEQTLWLYLTNGILTAFLWAHFFWPERDRRQLSIKSICALMLMEAGTFGAIRFVQGLAIDSK
jgi:hypothetical protein